MGNLGKDYTFRPRSGPVTSEAKAKVILARLATYHFLADDEGQIHPQWNTRALKFAECHKSRTDPWNPVALWNNISNSFKGFGVAGAFYNAVECLAQCSPISTGHVPILDYMQFWGPTYGDLAGREAQERAQRRLEEFVGGNTAEAWRNFYTRLNEEPELGTQHHAVQIEVSQIATDCELKRQHEEFTRLLESIVYALRVSRIPGEYLNAFEFLEDAIQITGKKLKRETEDAIGAKRQRKGTLFSDSLEQYVKVYFLNKTVGVEVTDLMNVMEDVVPVYCEEPVWTYVLKEAKKTITPVLRANADYMNSGEAVIPLSLLDPERIINAWNDFFEAAGSGG